MIEQEYENLTKLALNLEVAKIAGWENIKEWNPNPKAEKPVKTFQGTNKSHPELGIFIPNYVEDLNAITTVFISNKIGYHLSHSPLLEDGHFATSGVIGSGCTTSPALALCKLLLAIAPNHTQR